MADLFVVTGVLETLKDQVKKLDALIMVSDKNDIDWLKINDLAGEIEDSASVLIDESDSEI